MRGSFSAPLALLANTAEEITPAANISSLVSLNPALSTQPLVSENGSAPTHLQAPSSPPPPSDCGLAPVPDMTQWPLVALCSCLVLIFIWDIGAYWILGYEPPFRKRRAQTRQEPLVAKSSTAKEEPGADSATATKGYDEVEQATLSSKLPLLLSLGINNMVLDAGYALPVTYLPCSLMAKGADQTDAGLVVGLLGGGVVVGCLTAPYLLKVLPPLDIIRTSSILVGISSAFFGIANLITDPTALVAALSVCRVIFGFCMGCNETTGQSMIYRMVREDQIASVNGTIMSIRMLGMLGSPVLGSVLYYLGGAVAPMLFYSAIFPILYLVIACFLMPMLSDNLNPGANPNQATVLDIVRVCPSWWVFALWLVSPFYFYGIEPLMSPVLSNPPYNLDYVTIGAWCLITPASMTLSMPIFMTVHKKIGVIGHISANTVVFLVGLVRVKVRLGRGLTLSFPHQTGLYKLWTITPHARRLTHPS
uniref:Major facilitator superfamily (MFS) profile domain-containing protein n=1 Tax=Haptolina brevifila TaxID=156173 RepID=A0A7S2G4U5_9EUKA|mmetsp:Transcript_2706/g.5729  ORF Transcript_2706/g.5729 Transcript_2706/m.5729 type:complete len:478 (+) Transcript_2706:50-1483(+)